MFDSDKINEWYDAASSGDRDCIVKFLEYGIREEEQWELYRDNAFVLALENGRKRTALMLLEEGADVDFSNEEKSMKKFICEDNPLIIAVRTGDLEMVKLLIDRGASLKRKDERDKTPLYCAALLGETAILRFLIKLGDNVDFVYWGSPVINRLADKFIHFNAAEQEHYDCFSLLVRAGADTSVKDKFGETVLDIAKNDRHAFAYVKGIIKNHKKLIREKELIAEGYTEREARMKAEREWSEKEKQEQEKERIRRRLEFERE